MRRALTIFLAALALAGCSGLSDPASVRDNLAAKLSIVSGVSSSAVNVTSDADGAMAVVVFLETTSDDRSDQLKAMTDACKVIVQNAPGKGTMKLSAGSAASTMAGTVLQATALGFTDTAPTLEQAREKCR